MSKKSKVAAKYFYYLLAVVLRYQLDINILSFIFRIETPINN